MKKILCPTDFSDTAQSAIAYAAKLAQAIHADLTLLNVHSIFDFTVAEVFQGDSRTLENVAERLEAESRQISKAFKIGCYAEVESTARKLSTVINEKAQGYDLIVMGSNGPEDLYQFFSGTNTYNAIVESEIPLLLIPQDYVYNEIGKMVYAFDYFRERNLPLARLIPVVKSLNCDVTVLQIMEEAYSKEAEDELKELQFMIAQFHPGEINLHWDTVRSSDIPGSINSYVLRNGADVLALCSLDRNLLERLFHKSVIKSLTAFTSYPVLVFHAEVKPRKLR